MAESFKTLQKQITSCTACPRLRTYCQAIAVEKKRAYIDQRYWGKPVPGFGDLAGWLWVLGLAPGAHGANRTGRVFTGDRSCDFLFAALHRAKLANQPTSVSLNDGLQLTGAFISAAGRCAPPGNKPLPVELAACSVFLDREWDLLANKRVILALGSIAWDAAVLLAGRKDGTITSPRPKFGHGAAIHLGSIWLIGSYHVSQQNTFTGKLTPAMFDAVLATAKAKSRPQKSLG
ncbi:hypothetical protein BH10PLA1_BH10PLA1_18800 [soil metagenome]